MAIAVLPIGDQKKPEHYFIKRVGKRLFRKKPNLL